MSSLLCGLYHTATLVTVLFASGRKVFAAMCPSEQDIKLTLCTFLSATGRLQHTVSVSLGYILDLIVGVTPGTVARLDCSTC